MIVERCLGSIVNNQDNSLFSSLGFVAGFFLRGGFGFICGVFLFVCLGFLFCFVLF